MKSRPFRPFRLAAAGLAVGACSLLNSAQAATLTWDGGGSTSEMGTATNWTTDTLPNGTNSDVMQFNGTVLGNLSLTYLVNAVNLGNSPGLSLSMTSAQTGSLTIDGGALTNNLRLNSAGVSIASGAGAFALGNGTGSPSFNITIQNALDAFTNDSTNIATIRSDVSFGVTSAGAAALSFGGTGNWDVQAAVTPSNAASLAILKTGTGTLTLTGGGSLKVGPTGYGGSFGSVFKQGVTNMTAGTYAYNTTELVVGGADVTGTNTQLNLSNSTVVSGVSWLSIGRGNGTGTVSSDLTLSNSSSLSAANLAAGMNASVASAPKGTITLNDTATLNVSGVGNIAESANSNVTITVNNGTATFGGDLKVGLGATTTAKVVLNAGILNQSTTAKRWLRLGDGSNATSQLDVNGGELRLNTNSDLRCSPSAVASTNTVNLNGGAITGYIGNGTGGYSGTSVVDLQNSGTSASNNTFNLSGGILTIGQVITNNNGGTSAFNFNGGTIRAAAASANFIDLGGTNQKVYVKNGGAVVDSNGFNITIVDALQNGGTGGLTKQGAGTLTLSANALYTGATSVNQGTLTMAGLSGTSGVTMALGTTLQGVGTIGGTTTLNGATLTNTNPASVLNLGGLTLGTGASTINLNMAGTAGVVVAGAITTGGNTATINASNTGWNNGLNNLITGATFSGSISNFTMGTITGFSGRQTSGGLTLNGSNVALNVLGDTPIWVGANGGVWQQYAQGTATSGTPNWKLQLAATATDFWNADSAIFDDSATGSTTATIQGGDISATNLIFSNSSLNYTLNSGDGSKIAGGSLVKSGGGSLTVNVAGNTYNGTTTLNGGTLNLNAAGAVGGTGAVTVNAGTLNVNNAGALSGSGTLTVNGGTLDNTSGSAVTLTTARAQIWAGDLTFTGSNNLSFNGGAVTLSGGTRTVTLTGGTLGVGRVTSSVGGLSLAGNGTLAITTNAVSSVTGTLNVGAGATLRFNTGADAGTTNDFSANGLSGSGTIENGGGAERWLYINNATDNTFSGLLRDGSTGQLGLNKDGAGVMTLAGTNTYTGRTTIRNGTLTAGVIADVGAASSIGAGSQLYLGEGYGTQAGNGTLLYTGPSVTTNRGFNVSATAGSSGVIDTASNLTFTGEVGADDTGGFIKRGTGTLTLANAGTSQKLSNGTNGGTDVYGVNVANGKLVLQSGTFTAAGETVVGGQLQTGGAYTAAEMEISNGAVYTLNNWVSIGRGNGNTGLSSVITLDGGTLNQTLATQGIAMGYGAGVAGFNAAPVLNVKGASTLNVAGYLNVGESLGANATVNVEGTSVVNLTNTTLANKSIGVDATGTLNISGGTFNAGNGLTLGKNATGQGTVNLNGGILNTATLVKGAGTANLAFDGGTLQANASTTTFVSGLSSAVINGGGATVDTQSNSVTIGQALLAGTGSGGLTKTGAGDLTLTAASTYAGATTVNAGRLVVNGNITTSTLTTVSGTGTLSGIGMVGALTAASGGTVAPGSSPGILYAGSTILQSGSTLAIEIDGDTVGSGYDQLNVAGSVSLAGLLNVTLGYTPATDSLFFIVANDGADSVSGNFSGLSEGSVFNVSGTEFMISYAADSGSASFTGGNDVALKVIPEASSALLLGLGTLGLALRRRRA